MGLIINLIENWILTMILFKKSQLYHPHNQINCSTVWIISLWPSVRKIVQIALTWTWTFKWCWTSQIGFKSLDWIERQSPPDQRLNWLIMRLDETRWALNEKSVFWQLAAQSFHFRAFSLEYDFEFSQSTF